MKKKFELDWTWTPEQKEMSEFLFNSKLIKLYYSKNINISDDYFIPLTNIQMPSYNLNQGRKVCVFPERFMCLDSIGGLIKSVTESTAKEVIILTTTPYLMLEFTKNLVTIIDDYNLSEPSFDTLVANMHDVYYKTHGYDSFGVSKDVINKIIKNINNKKVTTDIEKKVVNLIGEKLLKSKLGEMIRENMPKKDALIAEREYLEARIAELEKLKASKQY